jgi:hypothetical protein
MLAHRHGTRVALIVSLSAPAHAQHAIRLELEQVTSDTKNARPDQWKVDVNQLTATWTTPWGVATFRAEIPKVIDAGGAEGRMSITVRAAASRFAPSMGFLGEVEPQSQVSLVVVAEPHEYKSQTQQFTLKPRANYSEGYSPVMQVRIGDAVAFYFKYRVVRGDVASPASASLPGARVCATPGIYLEQISKSEDARNMSTPDKWTHDLNAGTASWSPPWGSSTYAVQMPTVISPEGVEARMTIHLTAAKNSRYAAQIGFLGEVEPQSQVTLHLVGEPGETKSQTQTFVLKTRHDYSQGYEPTLLMRLDGGPTYYYKYRVVRCPTGG